MRNKRRVTALVVIATAAAVVAGGLMASNMGFKLNYPLQNTQSGVSKTGRNTIGLPYNRQVGIDTASQLLADVSAGGISAIQLEQFNKQFDTNEPYPGPAGDFGLVASEAYLLRVTTSGDYIIVGSHDPGLGISLLAMYGYGGGPLPKLEVGSLQLDVGSFVLVIVGSGVSGLLPRFR